MKALFLSFCAKPPLVVNLLFSPLRVPQYNGSIEAGIGSLKTRTKRFATRAGHPGYWTSDDVAAARSEANAMARPRGETGPTPDELWQTRRPLTDYERCLFQEAVLRQREHLGVCRARRNAVLSWSTAFFCSREGEFFY
jgi:hypothetical protein